jgi:hypothetical protein
LAPGQAFELAPKLWDIVAHLKVSTSETQIVAGSKALHHALPDLVPPIDRQCTFRFFIGQKRLFAVEGVAPVGASWLGRGRGLPMMRVRTPLIWKTSTCLTLPSLALT